MMQVNATRHCCVGGNLVEVPAFAGMTGNLVEVLVPAFAGMTFLRWYDSGCWDNGVCWDDVSSRGIQRVRVCRGGLQAIVYAGAEFFAGFEIGDIFAGELHGVAGLGVAAYSGGSVMQGEAAEAAYLYPLVTY